jgi:hypothetical protein
VPKVFGCFLSLSAFSTRFGRTGTASFFFEEFFPLFAFTLNLQWADDFGDAIYYAFVAAVSANQVAAVVDVDVAGFLVETEALNIHRKLGD